MMRGLDILHACPADRSRLDQVVGEIETVVLGEDPAVTIPTAGANYTDAKTVAAVQSALVKKGYDCGTTGPNHDGVDGVFGSHTKNAIKKMQADAGIPQTGIIDEGVIAALKVTPGVLPPGVTMQGRAAVQAQAADDAAILADHASTPADVQAVAQQVVDAAPPAPPELKQAAVAAQAKAKAATTPQQVKAAAAEVKSAAIDVSKAVKPSWLVAPLWAGAPVKVWQAGTGVLGFGLLLTGVIAAVRK